MKATVFVRPGKIEHCDETTWPIQIKEQDDGYMWTTSNKFGSYYCFEPTRSGRVVVELLKDCSGFATHQEGIGVPISRKIDRE